MVNSTPAIDLMRILSAAFWNYGHLSINNALLAGVNFTNAGACDLYGAFGPSCCNSGFTQTAGRFTMWPGATVGFAAANFIGGKLAGGGVSFGSATQQLTIQPGASIAPNPGTSFTVTARLLLLGNVLLNVSQFYPTLIVGQVVLNGPADLSNGDIFVVGLQPAVGTTIHAISYCQTCSPIGVPFADAAFPIAYLPVPEPQNFTIDIIRIPDLKIRYALYVNHSGKDVEHCGEPDNPCLTLQFAMKDSTVRTMVLDGTQGPWTTIHNLAFYDFIRSSSLPYVIRGSGNTIIDCGNALGPAFFIAKGEQRNKHCQ